MRTENHSGYRKLKTVCLGVPLLLAACLSLVACSNNASVLDKPIILHGGEYQKVLAEAERLSKESLTKRDKGEYLTDEDRDLLTKAVPQFQSLIDYDPGQFAPRLALGKIFLELDDPKKANEYLLYCLGALPEKKSPEALAIEAECRYELANARFKVGNYEDSVTEVDQAIAISQKNPNYYVARAAAYSELKRAAEAKTDILQALRLDPNHARAKSLLKLFLIAETNSAVKK